MDGECMIVWSFFNILIRLEFCKVEFLKNSTEFRSEKQVTFANKYTKLTCGLLMIGWVVSRADSSALVNFVQLSVLSSPLNNRGKAKRSVIWNLKKNYKNYQNLIEIYI